MHYAKMKMKQVRAICDHIERGIDKTDTHKHSNENIDKSKTHLNYDLVNRGGLSAYQIYKDILTKINEETKARTGKCIRKDAVTLCSWVTTLPAELSPDKADEFFVASYNYFCERYGKENIIASTVHKDEKTPHMHLEVMPIVTDKQGYRKLCAKDFETPTKLKKIHPDMSKYLTAKLGTQVELLNGATDGGNKTIKELKATSIGLEIEKAENKLQSIQNQALSYKQPKKKKLFESQSSYKERMNIEAQALATQQRQEQLDLREQELSRSELNAENKERNAQNIINQNNSLKRELSEVIEKYNRLVPMYNELTKSSEAHKKENENLRNALENLYEKHTGEYLPYDYILAELNPPKQQQKNDIDFNLMM